MIQILFIAGVERLTISEGLGAGDKFGDIFRITNDHEVVRALLEQSFIANIGLIEANSLISLDSVVYAKEQIGLEVAADLNKHLVLRLAQVSALLHQLWLLRDHSSCTELGYLQVKTKEGVRYYRNAIMQTMTHAVGGQGSDSFSRAELRVARAAYERNDALRIATQPSAANDVDRLSRAWYFLQAARAEGDLGVKVAHYCVIFECLFSSDSTELSHKLAERVACFLRPDDDDQRIELYRTVKKAYTVRSRVVHGVRAASSEAELKEVARACDDIARRVLKTLFQTDEALRKFFKTAKQEEHEAYLVRLVLGRNAT